MGRAVLAVCLSLLLGAAAAAEESVPANLVVLNGGEGLPGGREIEHVRALNGPGLMVSATLVGNRVAIMRFGHVSLEQIRPQRVLWTTSAPVQWATMDATGVYAISGGYLLKLNLADGHIVARRYVGSNAMLLASDGRHVFVTVAPARSPVSGDTFGFKLAAFSTANLALRWKSAIEMTPHSDATLVGDSIIVTSAGSGAYISFALQAFDRATGRRQWQRSGASAALAGFRDDSVFVQDHWINLDAYDPITVTQLAQDGPEIAKCSYAPDPEINYPPGENAPSGSAQIAGGMVVVRIDGHATYLYQLGANPQRAHPVRVPDELEFVDAIRNRLYFERHGVLGQVVVNDRTLVFQPLGGAVVSSFAGMAAITSARYGYVVDAAGHRIVARVPSPCKGYAAAAQLSADALVLSCGPESATVYTP